VIAWVMVLVVNATFKIFQLYRGGQFYWRRKNRMVIGFTTT